MSRLRRIWVLAAVAAGLLGITLSATLGGAFGTTAATGASPSASAPIETAQAAFNCRASVLSSTLAGTSLAEPAVAGSDTSCPDDQALVQKVDLLGASSRVNIGSLGPAGAYTDNEGSIGSGAVTGGTAVAQVSGLSISYMGYTLTAAGPVQSEATAFCTVPAGGKYATQDAISATADLTALTVTGPGLPSGGQTVDLTSGLQTLSGDLAPLGALISISANDVNEDMATATATADLLDIKLLGAVNGAQIIVGGVKAGLQDPNACSENTPTPTTIVDTVTGANGTVTTATTPGQTVTGADGTVTTVTIPGTTTASTVVVPAGSVPSVFEECAPGSTLDSSSGDCVIYDNGQPIFVSKPFKGPTGGTVVTLTSARGKYHSPCLSGPGPRFVLLVTKKNGRAKGTPRSDRILGLNTGQRLIGLAGNDCIDEQRANSHVLDGNGKDRIYVSFGYNRVIAGNGNNIIHGGRSRTWITDGTGHDYIYGGTLHNRIDAYGNKKHIFGGPSNDRIWTNSQYSKVNCGGGNHDILFARKYVAAYGKSHGCESVRHLR